MRGHSTLIYTYNVQYKGFLSTLHCIELMNIQLVIIHLNLIMSIKFIDYGNVTLHWENIGAIQCLIHHTQISSESFDSFTLKYKNVY